MIRSEKKPRVEQHYHQEDVLQSILSALEAKGKNTQQLQASDLLMVDAFHIRGREATVELAQHAELTSAQIVLDVGCALGGSARFLAEHYGCTVHGIDITPSYIDTAIELSKRSGFANQTYFKQASALALPYDDNEFDCVWTEHVQMNIDDKQGFYQEMFRVLKPGGQLLFHDVFQGKNTNLHYPVPWAESSEINHLISVQELQTIVKACGFEIKTWQDKTKKSLLWLQERRRKNQAGQQPAIGLHLLMSENMPDKIRNLVRNIEEDNIVIAQCILQKQGIE